MTQSIIEKLESLTRIHQSESGDGGYVYLPSVIAIIEQAKAEKQEVETHNGYIEGTAERLRLICSKPGIGAPVSNEEIMFCQFSLLGAIRRKIDEIYTTQQPDIFAEKQAEIDRLTEKMDRLVDWLKSSTYEVYSDRDQIALDKLIAEIESLK